MQDAGWGGGQCAEGMEEAPPSDSRRTLTPVFFLRVCMGEATPALE